LTTEQSAVPREALVGQGTATFATLDALSVPDAVEHVEQEPIEDRAVAAGTQQQHPAGRCVLGGGGVDGRHGRVAAVRLHSTTRRLTDSAPASPRTRPTQRTVNYSAGFLAGTHKIATTHAGNFVVPRDLDL